MLEDKDGMINLGGVYRMKVRHHMSEIKEELFDVSHLLWFHNKKQFMKWVREKTIDEDQIESDMCGKKPDYVVCGSEGCRGDWVIEFYKVNDEFVNADWSWVHIIGGIGHDCSIFQDDDGQYWFVLCDYD